MSDQILLLIMAILVILIFIPWPFCIFCWIRGRQLGHDIDFHELFLILLGGLIPGTNWILLFLVRKYLVSNEELLQKKKDRQLKEARTEYLEAYLNSQGHSIEDMDEWIESLTLIDKLTNKFK